MLVFITQPGERLASDRCIGVASMVGFEVGMGVDEIKGTDGDRSRTCFTNNPKAPAATTNINGTIHCRGKLRVLTGSFSGMT